MIVIADTSPLNYLIRLGHSNILQEIFGRVLVPHAVLMEMSHPDAPPDVRAWAADPPAWLEEVRVALIDDSLSPELGAGEREAISLALEVRADLLLIDERAGRAEAAARCIAVAGTLAVLLQASQRGYINFPETLKKLRESGFRTSRSVEASVIALYGKAKTEKP